MAADPLIGVDIKLNSGDLGYTQSGDLDLVGQVNPADNVWQAVALRLATTLATHLFASNYGTLMGQYVDEPITDDLQAQIEAEARKTILQDSRVASITSLTVTPGTGSITVAASIVTVSGDTVSGSVTIGG